MKWVGPYHVTGLTVVSLLTALGNAQTSRDITVDSGRAGVVRPLFDLRSPERSPFPSDAFTLPDLNQNTGRRVNLPMPQDCTTHPSDCEDIVVLNQLDGFNLQARISVPFDGDIDPASVTSKTVFLVRIRDALSGRGRDHSLIGINYIVWTPASRELSFRPHTSLDQHTTYALVVTTGVRDTGGSPIGVAENFGRMIGDGNDAAYVRTLTDTESAVRRAGVLGRRDQIAALAVFTTQTATHIVERMREAIHRGPAPRLNFSVGTAGERAVFADAEISTLTQNADINMGGALSPQPINLAQWRGIIQGAVGTVAFGTYRTLDFTVPGSGHIAPIPTRTGTLPSREIEVAFDLWLPAGPRPSRGWPVYIYVHGSFGDKNSGARIAAIAAQHGLATITINAYGRGFGPRTTMTVQRNDGTTMTFAAPGVGRDWNGDGVIANAELRGAPRPNLIHMSSGPQIEGVAQHFGLVRALQAGVDVDGDGAPDLDGARIYMLGGSYGAQVTVLTAAYDPAVRASAFVALGTQMAYLMMLQPPVRGTFGADQLAARTPSLINGADGLTSVDGQPVTAPYFNENLPLRDEPPRINTVTGAVAIQRVVDRIVWASMYADAIAFVPRLRRAPPAGVPARPFLVQWARGDQNTNNPQMTELILAGDFADRVSFYRHDLNFGLPGVPANPHAFFNTILASNTNFYRIFLGAQHQAATFFESDGRTVMHPAPTELWEVPIKMPLPVDLFYLPRPK